MVQTQPDWLLLTGFNEFIAQPQEQLYFTTRSMGLETDGTFLGKAFVDLFGVSFGREVEPTVKGGDRLYKLIASCVRVYRANQATGDKTCSKPQELCCQGLLRPFLWQLVDPFVECGLTMLPFLPS